MAFILGFFLYVVSFFLGIVMLLLWPNKGLCFKHVFILGAGGLFGGVVSVIFLSLGIDRAVLHPHIQLLVCLMVPIIIPFVGLLCSDSKGFSVLSHNDSNSNSNSNSNGNSNGNRGILFSQPLLVFKAYVRAHIIGLSLQALLLVVLLGIPSLVGFFRFDGSGSFFLVIEAIKSSLFVAVITSIIEMVVSFIVTLSMTAFIKRPIKENAKVYSLTICSITLVLLYSFGMIGVFLYVLPFVLVTSYFLFRILAKELGESDKRRYENSGPTVVVQS